MCGGGAVGLCVVGGGRLGCVLWGSWAVFMLQSAAIAYTYPERPGASCLFGSGARKVPLPNALTS